MYPYGIKEYVLVKVDVLAFTVEIVITDMLEDGETPFILGRPFLEIGRALIDVEMDELELRFNK